jgi:hypothetical protein
MIHTSGLVAITSKMTWLSTFEAGLISDSFSGVCPLAATGVILKLHLHFFPINRSVVQPIISSSLLVDSFASVFPLLVLNEGKGILIVETFFDDDRIKFPIAREHFFQYFLQLGRSHLHLGVGYINSKACDEDLVRFGLFFLLGRAVWGIAR